MVHREHSPLIGVFDSGVGGLTIAASIREKHPYVSIVYCTDNLNFPYGPRPESEVTHCAATTVEGLLARQPLDILVIACNTASTVALPALRQQFEIPIVGVVPAIKPAATLSQTKTIGLLATPGTIRRPYTDTLIRQHASDCQIVRIGSAELVEAAEAKIRGETIDPRIVADILSPLFVSRPRTDTVVLGCTHFPHLRAELIAAAQWPLQWVDSGEAIADRVGLLLAKSGRPLPQSVLPKHRCYFSQSCDDIASLGPYLRSQGFEEPIILAD